MDVLVVQNKTAEKKTHVVGRLGNVLKVRDRHLDGV